MTWSGALSQNTESQRDVDLNRFALQVFRCG